MKTTNIQFNPSLSPRNAIEKGYTWVFDGAVEEPHTSSFDNNEAGFLWLMDYIYKQSTKLSINPEASKKFDQAVENELIVRGQPNNSEHGTFGLYVKNPYSLIDRALNPDSAAEKGLEWIKDEFYNYDPIMPSEIIVEANMQFYEYMFEGYKFGNPGDPPIKKYYPDTWVGIYKPRE